LFDYEKVIKIHCVLKAEYINGAVGGAYVYHTA